MEETCKATITMGDSKITFEGPAGFVESQIKKFAVESPLQSMAGAPMAAGSPEKQLVLTKKPHGHHEIVAVLGFALSEAGNEEFSAEDVRRAYLRADIRPPKEVSQALRDAKNKFDYIVSGSKRGMFRLSNHGDRTVRFDLPKSEI